MAEHTLRFSRRRLLQIGTLAPLTALLTRGASAEQICEEIATVDPDVVAKLWEKGQGHGVTKEKFEGIAKMLWLYFQAGIDARGGISTLPTPDETEDDKDGNKVKKLVKLAGKMYDQPNRHNVKSGDLITTAMPDWNAGDMVTNGCAYLCGFYTAEAALDSGNKIDETIYRIGYKRTERQMTATLSRLRCRNGHVEEEFTGKRGAGC